MQTNLVSKYHQTSKILKDNLVFTGSAWHAPKICLVFLLQPQVNDKDVMSGSFFLSFCHFQKKPCFDF